MGDEPKTLADGSATADVVAVLDRELAAAEQEAAQATEAPAPSCALGPGGSIPLADLRERLKMLSDAWVEIYEDGPLRLRFDIEGRRMHVAGAQGQQGKVDW